VYPPEPPPTVPADSLSGAAHRADSVEAIELPPLPRHSFWARVRDYFAGEDPSFLTALVPTCFLSMLLYTRSPTTNFIFDEQEALLANPYVRAAGDPSSKVGWLSAFKRDFWGLTPDKTIGSYRPLPNLFWRALWRVGMRDVSAFPHDYVNVLIHGINGALLVVLVFKWTRDRLTAWLGGAIFIATAVVTEAVSGVVGLADVLGGAGALLALLALSLPLWAMPIALLAGTLIGLYSKESALCIVPLVPLAALLTSQLTHPKRPLRWARAAVAALTTGAAFVFYVEMRRRWFPVSTPHELTPEANAGRSLVHRTFSAALRWYAQPGLPHDRLNNPLVDATPAYRVAAALRVYARGLGQVLFPRALSGDYSSPQEPIPERLVFPESIIGAAAFVLPIAAAPVLGLVSWIRSRRMATRLSAAPVIAFALAWLVLSYFPVSNIPVVLPTVRAERFWYFPAIGSAVVLAVAFAKLLACAGRARPGAIALLVAFFGFQCFAARRHALDYTNDLVFWDATRKSAPNSAKAHLNYSVMLGARGDLAGRLSSNDVALRLAPEWPMASVYEGDTLCRLHRAPEGLPHYLRGFSLGPNDMNLIALGLQCLWDEHQLGDASKARELLQELGNQYPGSWLKYLVDDTLANGEEYKGVNPKYRPRGYNEGPKKDE
jgi:hypothetical protein